MTEPISLDELAAEVERCRNELRQLRSSETDIKNQIIKADLRLRAASDAFVAAAAKVTK
jgi:hypothetical protein